MTKMQLHEPLSSLSCLRPEQQACLCTSQSSMPPLQALDKTIHVS